MFNYNVGISQMGWKQRKEIETQRRISLGAKVREWVCGFLYRIGYEFISNESFEHICIK